MEQHRYYSIGGVNVAARTSTGTVSYLASDQHGTATLAIDAQTLAVTRRYYDPYGNPAGTQPGTWPGTRGFVGGTPDPATGLTSLGARQYNPAAGSFLSPDPLISPGNPQEVVIGAGARPGAGAAAAPARAGPGLRRDLQPLHLR